MCYSCVVESSGLTRNVFYVFVIIDINAISEKLTSDGHVKVNFIRFV